MFPLIAPSLLREYLIQNIVEGKVTWEKLYPGPESIIVSEYRQIFNTEDGPENEITVLANSIWHNFISKLIWNRSLLLFVQRNYINTNFRDFNQMENLEDTNTPWDWDHIYPSSWIYRKQNINLNTKHWNNSVGNIRALALEENRSENDSLSPSHRLAELKVQEQSFINENDWCYWSKITERINEGNSEMIQTHLSAVINRLCNIYEEWYSTLNIGELFCFSTQF